MNRSPPERSGETVRREWSVRGGNVSLERPVLMGIVNVTPDSFSDGGRHLDPEDAAAGARRLVEDGADVVDVGAESTRPGAEPVTADEEWRRLAPALERITELPVPVSVDTRRATTARRALERGAAIVNDVSGLSSDPGLADLAAASGAGLILMHMRGTPRDMQEDTDYADLVGEVLESLRGSVRRARSAGCSEEQLVVDPGIGFGKSPGGNLRLLARAGEFSRAGGPVMVGPSRKSFIGETLGLPLSERVEATAAACVMALERGARLFRVHDVREVRRALDMAAAVRAADPADGAGPGPRDSESEERTG